MNIYIYKCVIHHLYTIFNYFISYFPLKAFVNYFFIALCVQTLVFELFINMIIVWNFFHFIGRRISICFHSYKLYIFINASLPNNTKDALKEYCAINSLDCTILPWLRKRFSSFWQSRNTLHNPSMLPLHTQYDCTKQYITQSYWASRGRLWLCLEKLRKKNSGTKGLKKTKIYKFL